MIMKWVCDITGCIHMESLPGEYVYKSKGDEDVCGMYIIGLPHQLIEINFDYFDIACDSGGLLAVSIKIHTLNNQNV